jgi:hypothetical protein
MWERVLALVVIADLCGAASLELLAVGREDHTANGLRHVTQWISRHRRHRPPPTEGAS